MIKKILVISLLATLVGCNSDSDGNSSNNNNPGGNGNIPTPTNTELAALEASGAIPKLERGTDIVGSDTNNNGIRDDIEEYINNNYTAAPQRAAAIQSAKALQKALLIDTNDVIAVKAVNREIARADHCIYEQFDGSNNSKQPAQVSQEIESITTNTKQRLLAYLAFSKALDGTSWAIPEGGSCDE